MINRTTITIDPGKSGAAAWRSPQNSIRSIKCPDTLRGIWDAVRGMRSLADVLDVPCKAFIEKQHAGAWNAQGERIQVGAKSMWTFSANYHSWQMALIGNGIPFEEVSPQAWMKLLGALPKEKKDRKNELKRQAQNMFPGEKVTLYNADALMMLHALRHRE